MANELSQINKNELAGFVAGQELGNIIKPLVREIHLFDSFVAGTTHIDDVSILQSLKVGDKLTLQREDNKFDSNAIIIFTEDKKRIGYVPERDNIVFARLMDAGKLLVAYINKIDVKGTFCQISIGIHLVDF